MKPGVGTLDIFPSIWGRKSTYTRNKDLSNLIRYADWAGGPGDSKDDVEWLDKKMSRFFADNGPNGVNSLTEKIKNMLG
jgi:homoserine O-acetyltransferase